MRNDLQDLFGRAVAAGHAALDLTAEPEDQAALDTAKAACRLAQSTKVAYAFTGASNHGVDTFMTLKTAQPVDEHVLILLQSKQSASTGTHTLDYALEEMGKDLKNSGICVKGLEHVHGELHDMYAAQSHAFKYLLRIGQPEARSLLWLHYRLAAMTCAESCAPALWQLLTYTDVCSFLRTLAETVATVGGESVSIVMK